MASVIPTITKPSDNTVKVVWADIPYDAGTAANSTGVALHEMFSDFSDRSVQVAGTFGTGGSVTLYGSNDGTNYIALTDPQGNAITKTAAGVEQVMEQALTMRPQVTAGDGMVRSFPPGSVLLLEDTTGDGHSTRIVSGDDCIVFAVGLPPRP